MSAGLPHFGQWLMSQSRRRKYRYVVVNGVQYVQYDHAQGPLTRVSSSPSSQDIHSARGVESSGPRFIPEAGPGDIVTRQPHYQPHDTSGSDFELQGGDSQTLPARSSSLPNQGYDYTTSQAIPDPGEFSSNVESYGAGVPSSSTFEDDSQGFAAPGQLVDRLSEMALEEQTRDFRDIPNNPSSPPNSTEQVTAQDFPDLFITVVCKGYKLKAKIDFTADRSVFKKTLSVKFLEDTRRATSKLSTALGGRLTLPPRSRIYILRYDYEDLGTRVTDEVVHSPHDFSACDILFGTDWIRRHGIKVAQHGGRLYIAGRETGRDESLQQYAPTAPYPPVSQALVTHSSLPVVSTLPPVNEDTAVDFTLIKGTKGQKESLDDSYIVRKDFKGFFLPGRVFALLWHEPTGSNGTEMTNYQQYTRGRYNQFIYSSIRRMIVIRRREGCCWCCPITTYGKQGVAKAGLSSAAIQEHTIVYMRNTQPARTQGEVGMVKQPIAIDPASPREKLDQMSRLNFGKVYTVEFNVKVRNVGTVANGSKANFEGYVQNALSF